MKRYTSWILVAVAAVATFTLFYLEVRKAHKVMWSYHTDRTYEARGYINLCRSQGVASVESHADGTYTITCLRGREG